MRFRNFHSDTDVRSTRDARTLTDEQPPRTKDYSRFPRIELPPSHNTDVRLLDALASRASRRDFDTRKSMTLADVSAVLKYGFGINKRDAPGSLPRRYAPSGGALYPLECYLAAYRVNGLAQGIYHYEPGPHALSHLIMLEDSPKILHASGEAPPDHPAPAAVIIVTAVWGRTYQKYGDFAYRLALIEAGHATQNALLIASALDIKAYPVAGFFTNDLSVALDIEKEDEDPLYLIYAGD